jgi:hypothetical protein
MSISCTRATITRHYALCNFRHHSFKGLRLNHFGEPVPGTKLAFAARELITAHCGSKLITL